MEKIPIERQAEQTLRRLVKSADPYECRFSDALPARTILAPINGRLDEDQYRAVAHSAATVGDAAFYVAMVGERDEGAFWPSSPLKHLRSLTTRDFQAYEDVPEGGAEALWSPSGSWAAVISSVELFAVLGGTDQFLHALEQFFPHAPAEGRPVRPRDQVRTFLEMTSGWPELRWRDALLEHVYGPEDKR